MPERGPAAIALVQRWSGRSPEAKKHRWARALTFARDPPATPRPQTSPASVAPEAELVDSPTGVKQARFPALSNPRLRPFGGDSSPRRSGKSRPQGSAGTPESSASTQERSIATRSTASKEHASGASPRERPCRSKERPRRVGPVQLASLVPHAPPAPRTPARPHPGWFHGRGPTPSRR